MTIATTIGSLRQVRLGVDGQYFATIGSTARGTATHHRADRRAARRPQEMQSLATCAISTDGNTYCWGVNQFGELGELGDGTNTNRPSPNLVSGGLGFESVSAGGLHTCARTKDLGIVYCWGNNGQGQLGNATTTNSNVPVRVVDQR